MDQFAVVALEGKHCLPERRNLLNQKPTALDRRHKKNKVIQYPAARIIDSSEAALLA
jgi:hypothetical protein